MLVISGGVDVGEKELHTYDHWCFSPFVPLSGSVKVIFAARNCSSDEIGDRERMNWEARLATAGSVLRHVTSRPSAGPGRLPKVSGPGRIRNSAERPRTMIGKIHIIRRFQTPRRKSSPRLLVPEIKKGPDFSPIYLSIPSECGF